MAPLSTLASAFTIAALSGCAMTPNQVLETDALAGATLRANIAAMSPCLLNGMEDIGGAATVSQRIDPDGASASFRLHGHSDIGTMAVVRARRIGERTDVAVFITTAIFPRQPLADKIKAMAEGCDTR